jgi:hypothetical protein
LEHFDLWTFRQGLTKWAKLNRDVFTLTLGSQKIPPQALVVYVDNLIFFSRNVAKIDRVVMELCKLGVALKQEDDAAGFLGVKMERDSNTGLLEMKQTGLIERVIEALGLDYGYARGKQTPAETKPLIKDEDGVAAAEGFSYSSVVGMLLYLLGHTQLDITYAVNCCARYMFSPKILS